MIPQANHGLRGQNAARDGNGQTVAQSPLPVTFDKVSMLFDWVERGIAPAMHGRVTAGDRSRPLCSYPEYPHYVGGSPDDAASYACVSFAGPLRRWLIATRVVEGPGGRTDD